LKSAKLSFTPTISSPCEESWAAMTGAVRERHCELCDRQVHNFAAMTPAEIEKLVVRSGGKLCARITQREDGSLVTLEARPKTSVAAHIVASAAFALGAAGAAAQATPESPRNATAVLNGTVLQPLDSKPAKGAVVRLRASGTLTAAAVADEQGYFRISVPAGVYDIEIRHQVIYGASIPGANLHTGEQSLQPIQAHSIVLGREDDGSYAEYTVTMGEIIGIRQSTFSRAIRHPVSFLKYLVRKT